MKKIKLKMSITAALITAVVLTCVILLNASVAIFADKFPLKIDLTSDKVFEFSEQTKDVMKNLDSDVTAYALIPDGVSGEYIDYINEYLDKYKVLSDRFKVEYIDPYENPGFMNNYNDGEQQAGIGSVIIESGDDFKVVTFEQIYTSNTYTQAVQIDMERKVTNAVMSVTGALSGAKIYFTAGHGEYNVQNLKTLLNDEGYICEDLTISVTGIPEDANIVISAVPMTDFTAEERDSLDSFMDNGGRFLLIASPGMQPMEKLDGYLEEWGLKLNYDYVIETDENSALSSGYGIPIPVAQMYKHTTTEKIVDSPAPLAMPDSMSFSVVKTSNSSSVTKLLHTTEKSYGKKNINSTVLEKEEGDYSGPLCIGAISERMGDESSALMVIGSLSAFEVQQVINEGAYLNGDFILNSMSYLSGNSASSAIRAKKISAETMTMTENQVIISQRLLQWVLPLSIILIGLIVWLRRRYK
ncbi:MAG: hypothetical protein E7392_06105 [Ruminococcaceae bacterium]|nr:hypothetical protein [Oscillospiraceae bacterium]